VVGDAAASACAAGPESDAARASTFATSVSMRLRFDSGSMSDPPKTAGQRLITVPKASANR